MLRLLPLLLLGGCGFASPYVGYTHISDPQIDNDGLDFVCAGAVHDNGPLEARAALCESLSDGRDEVARVDINYIWR